MGYQPITIYCITCGRKVGTHDGRGTITVSYKCKKCNKIIQYNPLTNESSKKNIPQRKYSSGIRFW